MLARKLAQLAIVMLLTAAGEAAAQSFTPGDEKPEDYPSGADARRRSMPAPPAMASGSSRSRARPAGNGAIPWNG